MELDGGVRSALATCHYSCKEKSLEPIR